MVLVRVKCGIIASIEVFLEVRAGKSGSLSMYVFGRRALFCDRKAESF
jgi:hypothetical protein